MFALHPPKTRALVVLGTRPEAIKLAPVIRALANDPAFTVTTCTTSQHRDLLSPMLSFFDIRPDIDLGVMAPGQSLEHVTVKVLEGVAGVLARAPQDVVVVQGDTTTAFAAGLAAFYARTRLAHVEAGLRSRSLGQPFPEEGNRRLVDTIADVLLAPTADARANLIAEGKPARQIFVTGNTGIDALQIAVARMRHGRHPLPVELRSGERLALVTAHRRESFGPALDRICTAIRELSVRHPNLRIVYVVHPNPSVVTATQQHLRGHTRIHLVPALGYPDFVSLLAAADLVLTDSGGIQEEAPALGKRVLVLRETTERPEGVAAGAAELVGTDAATIVDRASAILDARGAERPAISPYGDGRAALRVAEVLRTGTLASPFVFDQPARHAPKVAIA